VPLENGIEHRTKLDGAAAHVESLDLKGHDVIVTGKIELAKSRRCFCHRLLLASTIVTRIDSIRDVAMTHSKNCMRDADGNRSFLLISGTACIECTGAHRYNRPPFHLIPSWTNFSVGIALP
jgi:hypothetical protein